MITIHSQGSELQYGDDGYVVNQAQDVPIKLQERGVAVLPGVLNYAECQAMNEGMWNTIEHLTSRLRHPVKRSDPKTYHSLLELQPLHGGLFQHFGFGHAQYVWDVRQNPNVAQAFGHIYQCDTQDLLVSFDGVNASLGAIARTPRGSNNNKRYEPFQGKSNLHLDQRLSDSRFLCVQSWVTANDIEAGDATLRFLSGSHKLHQEFAQAFSLTDQTSDWFVLQQEHIQWYKDRGCVDTCLTAKAGTQVFWDSRTAHCGIPYLPKTDCPKRATPRKARNVVYVCYQPRHDTTLELRRSILTPGSDKHLSLASHWPNTLKLFKKAPRRHKSDGPTEGHRPSNPKQYWSFVPAMPQPVLTEFGRRIAGVD